VAGFGFSPLYPLHQRGTAVPTDLSLFPSQDAAIVWLCGPPRRKNRGKLGKWLFVHRLGCEADTTAVIFELLDFSSATSSNKKTIMELFQENLKSSLCLI
jgi:hypothetical protein